MDTPKHNKVELPMSAVHRAALVARATPVPATLPNQNKLRQVKKSDTRFSLLVYLVLALAVFVGGYALFTGPLSKLTQAVVPSSASESTSTVYAYPLTIKADGSTQSKIDIFLSSERSLPLSGRNVTASTTLGTVAPTTVITDKMGHASYTLVMSEQGIATINFSVDNIPFAKQITIKGE